MPRTTLDIDAAVLRELKRRQARNKKKSLGELASELMARALAEPEPEPSPLTWTTAHMGQPVIDLDDKDALWAVLDER